MRVLYSFPHKLGADRICYTAWEQVRGLAAAGVDVIAMPGALARPVPESVKVWPTLAKGKLRIPYKLLGRMNACRLHDWIVARRLERMAGQVDIVHCWPLGSLETLKTAHRMGIPTVLERPNAHTRFCYETVEAECARVGLSLPHREYQRDEAVLLREEAEFAECFGLLCPSRFPEQSFLDRGFSPGKLFRHGYGFDETRYSPNLEHVHDEKKLVALFVGVDAVRKGLHLGLQAWLASPASMNGQFLIAGDLAPTFKERFAAELSHSSVVALGHRRDVPQLMRNADILVLPSLEEGFALVCAEAIGSGCVPVVSEACTEICQHMHNAMVHRIGDVEALTQHFTILHENRALLNRLRETCIRERLKFTWTAAGEKLLGAYQEALDRHHAAEAPSAIAYAGSVAEKSGIRA